MEERERERERENVVHSSIYLLTVELNLRLKRRSSRDLYRLSLHVQSVPKSTRPVVRPTMQEYKYSECAFSVSSEVL